jgi:hypothetical protein
MRWRKKVFRDFSEKNNGSSLVTHYAHDEWTIEELEHRVETNGTSGRFVIIQQPNWSNKPPVAFDSFDDAVRNIVEQEKEKAAEKQCV